MYKVFSTMLPEESSTLKPRYKEPRNSEFLDIAGWTEANILWGGTTK